MFVVFWHAPFPHCGNESSEGQELPLTQIRSLEFLY